MTTGIARVVWPAVLVFAAGLATGRLHSAPTRSPQSKPGKTCGEPVGFGMAGRKGKEGAVIRFARGDVSSNPPHHSADELGRLLYLDVLLSSGNPRFERFLVEPGAPVRPTFDTNDLDLFSSLGQRPQPIRVTLNSCGRVELIESYPWRWYGVLIAVEATALRIRGWRGAITGMEGYFQSWDPSYISKVEGAQAVRVPLGPHAQFAVNLDSVTRERLTAEVGRVVEITPDCESRARYVDVFKVNRVFNFMGGNRPVHHNLTERPLGTLLPCPKNERRFAFLLPGADSTPDDENLIWLAPNVKVYDQSGYPVPFDPGSEGYAGVWVDPKTKLATHVFWSVDAHN